MSGSSNCHVVRPAWLVSGNATTPEILSSSVIDPNVDATSGRQNIFIRYRKKNSQSAGNTERALGWYVYPCTYACVCTCACVCTFVHSCVCVCVGWGELRFIYALLFGLSTHYCSVDLPGPLYCFRLADCAVSPYVQAAPRSTHASRPSDDSCL